MKSTNLKKKKKQPKKTKQKKNNKKNKKKKISTMGKKFLQLPIVCGSSNVGWTFKHEDILSWDKGRRTHKRNRLSFFPTFVLKSTLNCCNKFAHFMSNLAT